MTSLAVSAQTVRKLGPCRHRLYLLGRRKLLYEKFGFTNRENLRMYLSLHIQAANKTQSITQDKNLTKMQPGRPPTQVSFLNVNKKSSLCIKGLTFNEAVISLHTWRK